jgi:hypothetical protein
MPIVPALGKPRQEEHRFEFKTSLDYIARLSKKQNKNS